MDVRAKAACSIPLVWTKILMRWTASGAPAYAEPWTLLKGRSDFAVMTGLARPVATTWLGRNVVGLHRKAIWRQSKPLFAHLPKIRSRISGDAVVPRVRHAEKLVRHHGQVSGAQTQDVSRQRHRNCIKGHWN